MKTLISTLALAAVIAATGAAQARDLASEFRTGFNPGSQRSLQSDLDRRHFEGQAKPDSFRSGVDLGGQ